MNTSRDVAVLVMLTKVGIFWRNASEGARASHEWLQTFVGMAGISACPASSRRHAEIGQLGGDVA